jgi:hypothetical protein
VKNPNTGKRQSQPNPPEAWVIHDVPAAKAGLQSDIERMDRQIKRLVDAILDGADAKPINTTRKGREALHR